MKINLKRDQARAIQISPGTPAVKLTSKTLSECRKFPALKNPLRGN